MNASSPLSLSLEAMLRQCVLVPTVRERPRRVREGRESVYKAYLRVRTGYSEVVFQGDFFSDDL